MITQSSDTHPEAEKVQISLLRKLTVAQKISRVRSLSQSTIMLSRRAIMRANPDLDQKELILKIISYHYGEKLKNSLRKFLNDRPL
jgi:hypothetical protein